MKVSLPPLHDQASALRRDFQAVCAGRLAGRGDEDDARPVLILKIGRHIIFDFNFMMKAQLAEAAHLRRHSEDPLVEIKVVRALVQQNATALACPCGTPAAGGIVGLGTEPVRDCPGDPPDFSEFAALHQRPDFLINRIRSLVEHRGKNLLLRPVGCDQPLTVRLVNGDRLLDEHMQSRVQRRNPNGRVGKMRGGDKDGVHFSGGDQFVAGCAAEKIRILRNLFRISIADGGERAPRNLSFQNPGRMGRTHVAESDDTKPELLH